VTPERDHLLELEEHVREMLEWFYEVAPSDCPYAAQVEAGLVRQREHTLGRLRDVEDAMGHNGAAP
jgi:hypothetical protein